MTANIATRPCFNSAARNFSNFASLVAKFKGSKYPVGTITPGRSLKAVAASALLLRLLVATGAKAEDEPTKRVRIAATDFMMTIVLDCLEEENI